MRGYNVWLIIIAATVTAYADDATFRPGARTLVEAHNCYPYHRFWWNRMDVALSTGVPLAVEIDLLWNPDAGGSAVIAHDGPFTGHEPTLTDYFFEAVRPVVEAALASEERQHWPLYTLNINDLRSREPELYSEVWQTLLAYADWLCWAPKSGDDTVVTAIVPAPVLVLTAGNAPARRVFYDSVPVGGRLLAFGQGNPANRACQFLRWVNYPWSAVEPGGQRGAGDWTPEDDVRLNTLVASAHERGYWIRFFSLNGHGLTKGMRMGWNPFYNFGSLEAARVRWTAARDAGVDFIATDQIAEARAWLARESQE